MGLVIGSGITGIGSRVESRATGGRLPFGIPTVARDPISKQFVKLSDEVKLRIREAAADGINEWINDLAELSLVEVPKGPRNRNGEPDLNLAGSIRYPGNDPLMAAHAEDLDAQIVYLADYAAAQHEGIAVRHHVGRYGIEKDIVWVVKDYTTPGTKSHYLEDPLKAMMPLQEEYVAKHVRAVL